LAPFRDPVHVARRAPEYLDQVDAVGQEGPGLRELARVSEGGQPALAGELDAPLTVLPPVSVIAHNDAVRRSRVMSEKAGA
jgi:hypothetical protein